MEKTIGTRDKMNLEPVVKTVEEIIAKVAQEGDKAVAEYSLRFDGAKLLPGQFKVSKDELRDAMEQTDSKLIKILEKSAENIRNFHETQLAQDIRLPRGKSSYVSLINRPLEKVGVYVPGGNAPLPSSVLMNVIPAKAAGVPRIVMATPPRRDGTVNPVILTAAQIAGVDEIYKVGGAQAIAALAYGTESIPAVDKICGPGNIYVNTAKRLVFGRVDIDMFAGPSEILIVADSTAVPEFLARDLMSQAEHDRLAGAILVTTDADQAEKVAEIIKEALPKLERREILEAALRDNGALLVVDKIEDALEFSNRIAPEHLELCFENCENYLDQVRHAGAVFLGNYTPESVGDYYAGPNHVLPTSRSARFFSTLNTDDFRKKMSVTRFSREDLLEAAEDIAAFARSEELESHARAVEVRAEAEGKNQST